MSTKYQRPAGAHVGGTGLGNRTKYQDDANAVPKRAISSAKVDGDLNYVIDVLNQIDDASGSRASINERLNVVLNADGSLKSSVTANLADFSVHTGAGTVARVDDSTFTLSGGDYRAIYGLNRRVKLVVESVAMVGDVAACTYADGLTHVSLLDLTDTAGAPAVISEAPTQVAYGPLIPGSQGNGVRRTDSLKITSSSEDYQLTADDADLVVNRAGSVVARISADGISGLAPASVGVAALASDTLAVVVPSGAVMPFAGSSAPAGWLFCAGQTLSRDDYATLFAAIGTTYGEGDGTTTFSLPNMRGRIPLALDNMGGTDAGVLNVANTLGATGGAQLKTFSTDGTALSVAQLPAHSHTLKTSGIGSNQASPAGGLLSDSVSSIYKGSNVAGSNDFGTSAIANTGSGATHSHTVTNVDMLPPYLLLNYIIKV